MICQPILQKAEKQLLTLFLSLGRRLHQPKCCALYPFQHESHRYREAKRCFVSLPPRPVDSERSFLDQCDVSGINGVEDHEKSVNTEDANAESGENRRHIPVMVDEVLSFLEPKDNQVVVDMTFGAGGHARQILKTSPGILHYIGADRDPTAFGLAQEFANKYREGQVIPLLSKFSELPIHFERVGIQPGSVDCFLMDLGVSSIQFDSAARGFALSQDGPLDMRMDGERFPDSLTAADMVNSLEPHDLARVLKKYGEERNAKAIAHAIVEARYAFGKYTRTSQLADVVKAVFDSNFRHDKLHRHAHVATKTFQALRIFVNDELNELYNGLEVAHRYLKPNGRCAVISFHSLEDRIVKRHFHGIDMDLRSNISIHSYLRNSSVSFDNEEIKEKYLSRQWNPMRRKVVEPSSLEVIRNPRSRSAKFRAAVKMIVED